ncbi:MAG: hypothetical protein MJZ25_02105 [Fibrobacter sp.]|nr:hypothetical protein [Fibrobacter sp.]
MLKSAAKIAKGIGVTAKIVCRWVQDYRRQNNLPSYEEDRRLKRNSIEELIYRRTYADMDDVRRTSSNTSSYSTINTKKEYI